MRPRHYIEYAGARLLLAAAKRLSPEAGDRLGAYLGDLAFDIVRKRRTVAIDNLAHVFSEQADPEEIVHLARSVYRHLGRIAIEHARLLATRISDIRNRLDVSGDEHIAQALERGNGAVLVTGHFGYWELLGATVAALGYPIGVVAKDQHNPAVNRMINRCRERLGMRVIPMASATRAVLRTLRRNECVGLLADQDAGPEGAFVPFLGRTASTYQGPAVFARHTGAPIIPCFIIRDGIERHRVVFETPIDIVATDDEETDVHRYTRQYTAVLEQYIRMYPDHWLWVHRRWKTQPQASFQNAVEQTGG